MQRFGRGGGDDKGRRIFSFDVESSRGGGVEIIVRILCSAAHPDDGKDEESPSPSLAGLEDAFLLGPSIIAVVVFE